MKKRWLAALLPVLLLAGGLTAWFWRDITFNLKERTEAERTVKAYADAHGIRFGEYPESLIALLERNPETEEFVLNYPLRNEVAVEAFSPSVDGGVPLLMQWDVRWGYTPYGSDVAGLTGCGPLCLSMAGLYVSGGDEAFQPQQILAFAKDNGYCSPGNGSSWTLISEGGVRLGLDVTEIPLVKKRIFENLEAGHPIICAMGPGSFTTTGHYIVLVGCEDGMIRVNDPNSRSNSQRLWSYEEMESQFRNLWVIH